MRKKMQQMFDRLKNSRDDKQNAAVSSDTPHHNTSNEVRQEDWDMSPQDALRVGIVGRRK
ncbi:MULTISPECIES: hypothetical protein [Marinobacter]|uniref:hypothetical protein n=1 Tax=Marinobacter TaxID=2742 RepID=UPI000DAB545D|nr:MULTISPECIES: hypothetical protein [Marinobacter]